MPPSRTPVPRRSASPRRTRLLVIAAAVLSAAPHGGVFAQESRAPETNPDRAGAHADLHVRYAEARLALAEVDLERARQLNRRFANLVPAGEIAALEDRVGLLRGLARQARDTPHGHGLAIQRAAAHAAAARAAIALESARAARRTAATALSDIDLARLELRLEVARLRADLWDDATLVPSLIDDMQLHIEQVQEQLAELQHEVETIRASSIVKP